jgi:hypothetical protein
MSLVENPATTTRLGGVTGRGFMPGRSGNAGGRPHGLARRVRELVGDDGGSIAEFMLIVMLDQRERTRDRLEAARFLAERGWGKAVQTLEVDVPTRSPVVDPAKLAELTDDELQTMILLLHKIGRADCIPRSPQQAGAACVGPSSGG